jgi:hypothetical protein
MNGKKTSGISRREFARRAALASAAATLAPATVLSSEAVGGSSTSQQPPDQTKQSPEAHAEVEARIQAILGPYGNRFSKEQKADIRRLCTQVQQPLERLRAYPVENGDAPALYLKPLVERETKHAAPTTRAKSGTLAPGAKPATPAKKN